MSVHKGKKISERQLIFYFSVKKDFYLNKSFSQIMLFESINFLKKDLPLTELNVF